MLCRPVNIADHTVPSSHLAQATHGSVYKPCTAEYCYTFAAIPRGMDTAVFVRCYAQTGTG